MICRTFSPHTLTHTGLYFVRLTTVTDSFKKAFAILECFPPPLPLGCRPAVRTSPTSRQSSSFRLRLPGLSNPLLMLACLHVISRPFDPSAFFCLISARPAPGCSTVTSRTSKFVLWPLFYSSKERLSPSTTPSFPLRSPQISLPLRIIVHLLPPPTAIDPPSPPDISF